MALTSMVMGQHIKGFQDLLYLFSVQDNKKKMSPEHILSTITDLYPVTNDMLSPWLNCRCPFPDWCLGQDVEFDCISS